MTLERAAAIVGQVTAIRDFATWTIKHIITWETRGLAHAEKECLRIEKLHTARDSELHEADDWLPAVGV